VVDRHGRQVPAEPVPFPAVVERDVDPGLAPRVEEAAPRRSFADHPREVVGTDPVRDLRPGPTVVRRLPEVRTEVIELVAGVRDERDRRIVRRRLDDRDERERTDRRRRDVLPGLAVVPRDVQETVVAPRPEHAALDRRLREREDRAVVLGTGVVLGDRTARWTELALVVAREVRTKALPGRSFVGGAEDVVSGVVQDVRVVRGMHGRRGPLHAVLERARALAGARLGPHHDVARLTGPPVVARENPLIVAREDDVRIVRAYGDV